MNQQESDLKETVIDERSPNGFPSVELSSSRIDELTSKIKELLKQNNKMYFYQILEFIKNNDENYFVEITKDTSFAELMEKVVEKLESEITNKQLLEESQQLSIDYTANEIATKTRIENPDTDQRDWALNFRRNLEAKWDEAMNAGIPQIVIVKDFIKQQAQEARLLRMEIAKMKQSKEYENYKLAFGGFDNEALEFANLILEIQKKAKAYGFYPDFETNETLGVYNRN